jgi:hypothetical protein
LCDISAAVARLAALEAENAELQTANKRLAEVSSQMEALKKVVANMQEKESGGVKNGGATPMIEAQLPPIFVS